MTEQIARIEDGRIAEVRSMSMQDVPEHKRYMWRPFAEERETYDTLIADLVGPSEIISDDSAKRVWKAQVRDLALVKQQFRDLIDDRAEDLRLKYITPGHGKAMTYREKFEQAKAVEELGEATANALSEAERIENYPTLAASVPIEAPTLWSASQLVIDKAEQWAGISYFIEIKVIQGKAEIDQANTAEDVASAFASITWSIE